MIDKPCLPQAGALSKIDPPRKRKRIRKIYADMRVHELRPGCWGIVEVDYERVVISGFATMAGAWTWLDLNTSQDRAMFARYRRVRDAFSR